MIASYELGETSVTIRPKHERLKKGIFVYKDPVGGEEHYFKEGSITPIQLKAQLSPKDSWIFRIEAGDGMHEGPNIVNAAIGKGILLLAERVPFNVGNGGVDPDDFDGPLRLEGPATITSGLQSELYKG